jgi:hypothetical protein
MKFRLTTPWPLEGGRALVPTSTIIDSASPDHFSQYARGLIPPYDATALDAATYQFMWDNYPFHHHLMGPPPP